MIPRALAACVLIAGLARGAAAQTTVEARSPTLAELL